MKTGGLSRDLSDQWKLLQLFKQATVLNDLTLWYTALFLSPGMKANISTKDVSDTDYTTEIVLTSYSG